MIEMEIREPLLEVRNLSVSYEEQSIINNISFSINKGEKLLLLGPSGSGKSSLALCLNGLIPNSIEGDRTGSIKYVGKEIQSYEPGQLSSRIGVVFQDPDSQFCMLTVEDEIAFGLENIKIPKEEMKQKIEWSLSLVGLEEYKKAYISTLSGGMKQKLALACVMAMEPELMILDEPTALLDPMATKEFVVTIDRLQRELDFSLIVIEHKLDYWVPFIDRTLVFTQSGQLLYDGSLKKGLVLHFDDMKDFGICLPKVTVFGQQVKENFYPITVDELMEELDEINGFFPLQAMNDISSSPLIRMENVSFSRGEKKISNHIHLSLNKGEWTAIVGPNGAGKSTLTLLLAGLLKEKQGEIYYKNKAFKDLDEKVKLNSIGYVFQNPEHQFIADTVFEEIAFGPRMKNIEEIDLIVSNILSDFRLLGLKDHNPFTLSQGQKRRLSVATMLVDEREFLILDEPTFGQDEKATNEMMKMIQSRVNLGMSALMVTHDMELVAKFAHQVIVLVEGKVMFQGTPHELFIENSEIVQRANLDIPLLYSIWHTYGRRGEPIAASVIKS
ncbi:ABC transporter ATP-binding protein [Heyndrickxia vini]|uniref:ABC transporter ATP-binding protein n=1 Tax=Heyndrickxia vini TaxID=1476025 RepID=A0ABX7E1E0_9BACI|nr:ABC transporter ATP-binding protein [Heyndrickxia vini]QQZ09133.1 ABC transporter ATP-binding protein [Heyndrickxia vini]